MSPAPKFLKARTRVSTPHGTGTVTHPNAIAVRLDVPLERAHVEIALISPSQITVIDEPNGGEQS